MNKKLHSKNFYYITTISLIVLISFSYFVLNDFYRSNVWNVTYMWLRHLSVQHLVSNMITLLVVGLFLEKHFGSFKFLLVFLFAAIISAIGVFCFSQKLDWQGASGTIYFLYAIFFMAFIFNFSKFEKQVLSWIVLSLIIVFMCWNGSDHNFFKFGLLSDLFRNIGHWSSFLMGLISFLFVKVFAFVERKKT